MKHDELVKKLRSGCDANTAFLLCYEAADAIEALQARVADAEALAIRRGEIQVQLQARVTELENTNSARVDNAERERDAYRDAMIGHELSGAKQRAERAGEKK